MDKFRIEDYLSDLKSIFERYPQIAGVVLFGSYLTPYFNERSDLDFGIIFYQSVELFTELAIDVDISQVLATDRIDVVNLNKAPLILQYNAISKGRVIYEKDYEAVSDFLEGVFRAYCDYEYDYRVMCAEYDASLRETYLG